MTRPNSNSIFVSDLWNLAFIVNTYNDGTIMRKDWMFRFSNIVSAQRLGTFYGSLCIYYTDLGFFHIIDRIEDNKSYQFTLNDLGYIEFTDLKEYTIREFKELFQQHQFNNDLSRNLNGTDY